MLIYNCLYLKFDKLNGGKSEKLSFFMYIYIDIFIYMDNKVIIDDGVDNDIE